MLTVWPDRQLCDDTPELFSRNINDMHTTKRGARTRLAVIAVAAVCLSGCAPRVVSGQAVEDPTVNPGLQNQVTQSHQPQQRSTPSGYEYPKTDRPTEHPEVGLGVPTHPPTDFSLIPGN